METTTFLFLIAMYFVIKGALERFEASQEYNRQRAEREREMDRRDQEKQRAIELGVASIGPYGETLRTVDAYPESLWDAEWQSAFEHGADWARAAAEIRIFNECNPKKLEAQQ
jgi:hypothetical protein